MLEKQKLNVGDVGKGDIMVSINFMKVLGKDLAYSSLRVLDLDTGLEFEITGNPLINQCESADRFFEERKVTRTEMAEVLSKAFNIPKS